MGTPTPVDINELVAAARLRIREVEPGDCLAGEALVVDVREPAEFAQGHLPGAVNLPRGVLSSRSGRTRRWPAAPPGPRRSRCCSTASPAGVPHWLPTAWANSASRTSVRLPADSRRGAMRACP